MGVVEITTILFVPYNSQVLDNVKHNSMSF